MLEPHAGLAGLRVKTDAFSETCGDTALSAGGQHQDFAWSTLGLRGAVTFGNGRPVTLKASAAWQHGLDDASVSTTLAFVGSDGFTVAGAPLSRDSLLLDAGIAWQVRPRVTLDIAYSGEVSESRTGHAMKVGLSMGF
jgi:subtilase-type serine protease